jgi:hypothetical protein
MEVRVSGDHVLNELGEVVGVEGSPLGEEAAAVGLFGQLCLQELLSEFCGVLSELFGTCVEGLDIPGFEEVYGFLFIQPGLLAGPALVLGGTRPEFFEAIHVHGY